MIDLISKSHKGNNYQLILHQYTLAYAFASSASICFTINASTESLISIPINFVVIICIG